MKPEDANGYPENLKWKKKSNAVLKKMYLKEKQLYVLVVSREAGKGEKISIVLISIHVVEHGLQV